MRNRRLVLVTGFGLCFLMWLASAIGGQPDPDDHSILLVETPAVSSNGQRIAFSWIGEIWTARIDGSDLRRLTHHPAEDSQPLFSPDDSQIAFVSDRTGSQQVFVMTADGRNLRQVTWHSEGYKLCDWFPDGKSLLTISRRDHHHRDAERMFKVSLVERRADELLVDAAADNAKVSPDGRRVLFTREGERWWRKGYQGERASQIWMYDLETGKFSELLHEGVECMWPLWKPDGRGFYFTKGELHGFDLWEYRFPRKRGQKPRQRKVFGFPADSIVFHALSADGSTIVFRHLFDLYVFRPGKDKHPTPIRLSYGGDVELPPETLRRQFNRATQAAFTRDGLEIALVAGGDIWVMDTRLREPRRVTRTDAYESDVTFSPDGQSLWFVAFKDGQPDIWTATRRDSDRYWWQNEEFELRQVTDDPQWESNLKFSPDGKQLVFQQGRGDLVVMDLASGEKRLLVRGHSAIEFDIAADSYWIAYSQPDDNFNREIWIASLDGSVAPVNVSRHPDNDYQPRFSPDGQLLVFTGRHVDQEVDIFYVYLQEKMAEQTERDRRMEEALKLMQQKRESSSTGQSARRDGDASSKGEKSPEGDAQEQSGKASAAKEDENADQSETRNVEKKRFKIDFDRIHERIRRISIPNSTERQLVFAPDGKKLLFAATIDGKEGWYTVEFPDKLKPSLYSTTTGSQPVWTKEAGGILFLRDGVPGKLESGNKFSSYPFSALQEIGLHGWLQHGFEVAWLIMRDSWYDPRFNNRDWDAIRRKYLPAARQTFRPADLAKVIELMLGELNGSHLGFYPSGPRQLVEPEITDAWRAQTAHLGVRFDDQYGGPGLKVRDVIKNGPADREVSKLYPGDVIMAIDGQPVDPAMDLTGVLNGPLDRDIDLRVLRTRDGKKRELAVVLRPISYGRARELLYDQWVDHNRKMVDELSGGRLGYLHIRAMNMSSFYDFERELYNVGYGRNGLVIDVRDNGGGSTTDLLLTALTQPRHAVTIPRGGGQGYPQDRAVFATWHKPIVVLCNQNSYSNAEIFSHAIKTLGRGKVVGVRTTGGVISTGSAAVIDVGRIRVPFRGWFLITDGEDMERNGCVPDVTIWPLPGELPRGVDRQLEAAIEVLLEEAADLQETIDVRYASERDWERPK